MTATVSEAYFIGVFMGFIAGIVVYTIINSFLEEHRKEKKLGAP